MIIFQINAEEGDKWEFALPDTGGTLWSDNLLIPKSASNQTGAEALMDFYYRPEIAAKLAAWNYYICPVKGAQEEMQKIIATPKVTHVALSEIIIPAPEGQEQAALDRAGQIVAEAFPDTDIRARQDWRDRELSALDAHLRARSERTA